MLRIMLDAIKSEMRKHELMSETRASLTAQALIGPTRLLITASGREFVPHQKDVSCLPLTLQPAKTCVLAERIWLTQEQTAGITPRPSVANSTEPPPMPTLLQNPMSPHLPTNSPLPPTTRWRSVAELAGPQERQRQIAQNTTSNRIVPAALIVQTSSPWLQMSCGVASRLLRKSRPRIQNKKRTTAKKTSRK